MLRLLMIADDFTGALDPHAGRGGAGRPFRVQQHRAGGGYRNAASARRKGCQGC